MTLFYYYGNTLLSFVAGWLFLRITSHFLEPKPGMAFRAAAYVIHIVTASMVIQIGDAFNILATLPFFLAALFFCYRGEAVQRLSVAMLLFTITTSVNAIFYDVVERMTDFGAAQLSRVLFWLAISLLVRFCLPHERPMLSPRLWLSLDSIALMPFLSTLCSVIMGGFRNEGRHSLPVLLLFFSLFCGLALLFTVVIFARQTRLEQEQTLWQMRDLYYQNLEQEQLQVRRLRHDMANHLQAMAGLDDAGMRMYLGELVDSPAMRGARRLCENDVVNAVLASKTASIDEAGIDAELRAEIPAGLAVADADLCALFANALDNAIEACRKLPLEKRRLTLRARADKGLLMLRLQNSAPPAPGGPDKFRTTKNDARLHGLGLAGIREIAARLGGSLDLNYEGEQFTLTLSVPI